MVRLFNVYHPSRTFVLVCTEAFLISFSFVLALFFAEGPQFFQILNHRAAVLQLGIVTVTCILCLYYFDLYDFQSIKGLRSLCRRLFQVLGTSLVILGGVYYLFPSLVVARGIYFYSTFILLAALFTSRVLFTWFNRIPSAERVVFLGMSHLSAELSEEIRLRPELGMNVVGYLDENAENNGGTDLAYVGVPQQLEELVKNDNASMAIVGLRDRRGRLPVDLLLKLRVRGLKVHEAGTLYEQITGKIPVENLFPSWLIFSDGFRLRSRTMLLQRFISLTAAALGLILTSPILLLCAIAIKLESKGPVFYKQERVGRTEKPFTIYKLRSMRQDAEKFSGAVWAADNDSRVTRIGRYLRSFRLDELPQLWNVLRGDMNLVGPRPERPEFVQMLEQQLPYYAHRHVVRPGVTGWAQIRFRYGSTLKDQQEKLRYDFFYIKNISLSLDLYVMFQTVKIILLSRGAR